MEAAPGFSIEAVKGQLNDALAGELLAFWTGLGALNEQQGRERLPQVLAVLRDANGAIVGVNSAVTVSVPQLGQQYLDQYRNLLIAGADLPANQVAMLQEAWRLLAASREAGERPESLGMFVMIPDPVMQQSSPAAVWPNTGLIHAGYTPDGTQIRVRYYEGVRLREVSA